MRSKTAAVLAVVAEHARAAGASVETVSVRDFPAEALLFGDGDTLANVFLLESSFRDAAAGVREYVLDPSIGQIPQNHFALK